MQLVGFIIRIYHDARSSECQIPWRPLTRKFVGAHRQSRRFGEEKEILSLPWIEPQFLVHLDRSVVSRLAYVASNNELKRKQKEAVVAWSYCGLLLNWLRKTTIKLSTCDRSSGRGWNSDLPNHGAGALHILSPWAVSFTMKAMRHGKLLVREWVLWRNGANKDVDDGEMAFRYWRTLT